MWIGFFLTICCHQNTIALDLYLAYIRSAFHTCYYCASMCDHAEELQRKCIKHVRKPLPKAPTPETEQKRESSPKPKEEEQENAVKAEDDGEEDGVKEEKEDEKKGKDPQEKSKEGMLRERDAKGGEQRDWKRNGTSHELSSLNHADASIEDRWLEWLDNRVALLINKDAIDVRDYGGKHYEECV